MTKLAKLIGVSVTAIVIGTQIAHAQEDYFERDRVEGAGERYHEEFEPRQLNLGSWLVNSQLRAGVESNSNIFAQEVNEESDVMFRFRPEAVISSNWTSHMIQADIRADHLEYSDLASESRTEFLGALRGRLDVSRDFTLEANVGAEQRFERRGETGAVEGVLEPGEYAVTYGGLAAQYQRDRIELRLSGEVRENDYKDLVLAPGSLLDANRDYRDFTRTDFVARAAYAISPDIAVFTEASLIERDHDIAVSPDGFNLDSETTQVLVGVDFQLPQLVRGDFAVGYLNDKRSDPQFEDQDAFSLDANLDWLPTSLTTVRVGASRFTTNPGLATVPTSLNTEARVRIDHELKRNVLLFGRMSYGQEEFEEPTQAIDFDYKTRIAAIGATYKMNPHAHFDLALENRDRSSDRIVDEFDQNVISVGVRLFP